jgi:sec-independent protein translocase protein TatA
MAVSRIGFFGTRPATDRFDALHAGEQAGKVVLLCAAVTLLIDTPFTVTAMGSLGPFEIILIFLVILLIFGAKRIPEIARGLGKGIREFKDATSEISRELTVDDKPNRIQSPRQGEPMARPQQQYQAPVPPPQPETPPPAEEPSQQASS